MTSCSSTVMMDFIGKKSLNGKGILFVTSIAVTIPSSFLMIVVEINFTILLISFIGKRLKSMMYSISENYLGKWTLCGIMQSI